jgi:hypothetical protein
MMEGVERAMVVEEVLCVVDTNIPDERVQVKGEWTLTQLAHVHRTKNVPNPQGDRHKYS